MLNQVKPELMTPENISYLIEKQVYQIFGRMLQNLAKSSARDPMRKPIHGLIEMLEEEERAKSTKTMATTSISRWWATADSCTFPKPFDKTLTLTGPIPDEEKMLVNTTIGYNGYGTKGRKLATAKEIYELHYRFQALISNHRTDTPFKVLNRAAAIEAIFNEFQNLAVSTVQTIIEERNLSDDKKCIAPIPNQTNTYLHAGMVIRISSTSDSIQFLGSRENASKILSHERKAISAVLSANVPFLHVPLSMKISYMGQHAWIHIRLPLTPDSLVYGTIDGGYSFVEGDPVMASMMKRLGEELNLKPHCGGRDKAKAVWVYTPADIQGYRCKLDGLYCLMSLSRMFPPCPPSSDFRNSTLVRLFRPETVQVCGKPLNPDAFSAFETDPDDGAELELAADTIISKHIPVIAQLLMRQDPGKFVTTNFLVTALHCQGINLRYMGHLLPLVVNHQIIARALMLEMTARTFRGMLEDSLHDLTQHGGCLEDCEEQALLLCHNLIDIGEESEAFWKDFVRARIIKKYGLHEGMQLIIKQNMDRAALLHRICQLCGIRLGMTNEASFIEFAYVEDIPLTSDGQTIELVPVSKTPEVKPLNECQDRFNHGQIEESIVLYTNAISLIEKVSGTASPCLVPQLRGLATCYMNIGDEYIPMAESALRRILVIRELETGISSIPYIDALSALVDFYIAREDLPQCVKLLATCIDLAKGVVGPDHAYVARHLQTLGNVYYWLRNFEACRHTYHEALEVRERVFGPNHPEVADSFITIGLFVSRIDGKLHESIAYFERALAIMRSNYGDYIQPDMAKAIYHLACLTYHAKQFADAYILFEDCLPMLESCYGPNDPVAQSCRQYMKALSDETQMPGPAFVIPSPNKRRGSEAYQAELQELVADERFVEAIPLYGKQLEQAKGEFGAESPEYGAYLMSTAHVCHQGGQLDQSAAMYRKAVDVLQSCYDTDHIYVADARKALSDVYKDKGEYEPALTEYQQAMKIWDQTFDDNPTFIAECLTRLGELYAKFGKNSAALEEYRKALEIRTKELGADAPKTVEVRQAMDKVYAEIAKLEMAKVEK